MGDLMRDFVFVELGDVGEGAVSEVEVLRTGTFRDRNGTVITITDEDIEAYVTAFAEGAAGQEVPVDVQHERSEAAGWVQELRRAGDRLLATVDWNELGRKLVGERVYRYVSATIDLTARTIKAISLVNFPAVKGLRPVELGEGVYGLEVQPGLLERLTEALRGVFVELEAAEEDGAAVGASEEDNSEEGTMTELSEERLAELREEIRQEELAKMEQDKRTRAELEEEVRAEVQAELEEQMARRAELAAFAEEVCNGERVGLSVDPRMLIELMEPMDDEQLERLQTVLRAKAVDFSEHGSSREGESEVKALPDELAAALDSGELTLEDLGNPILELGDLGEYDLSKWEG